MISGLGTAKSVYHAVAEGVRSNKLLVLSAAVISMAAQAIGHAAAAPVIAPRSREYNVAIYRETMQIVSTTYAKQTEETVQGTRRIDYSVPAIKPNPHYPTQIFVMNCTTSQMLQKLVEKGYKPLGLNMANEVHAGGGVRHGSNAQEEILMRQSNGMPALLNLEERGQYPIPTTGGIYSPGVLFFRKDPQEGYAFLEKPFQADLFASAAFTCFTEGGNRPEDSAVYQELTKEKMRTMFRSAIEQDNDSLALCAFGCGAFRNDPALISKWYADVLAEPEFQGRFKVVAFGIVDDHKGKNFQPFKEQFPGSADFATLKK